MTSSSSPDIPFCIAVTTEAFSPEPIQPFPILNSLPIPPTAFHLRALKTKIIHPRATLYLNLGLKLVIPPGIVGHITSPLQPTKGLSVWSRTVGYEQEKNLYVQVTNLGAHPILVARGQNIAILQYEHLCLGDSIPIILDCEKKAKEQPYQRTAQKIQDSLNLNKNPWRNGKPSLNQDEGYPWRAIGEWEEEGELLWKVLNETSEERVVMNNSWTPWTPCISFPLPAPKKRTYHRACPGTAHLRQNGTPISNSFEFCMCDLAFLNS